MPRSDLYAHMDNAGISDAYALGDAPPLPWPPRQLDSRDLSILDALAIQPPAGYGYTTPLLPDTSAPHNIAAALAQILLQNSPSASPLFGTTGRAMRRCRSMSGCDPARLARILATAGDPSANAGATRFSDPLDIVQQDLPGFSYQPPSPPPNGPATALSLELATPSGQTPGAHAPHQQAPVPLSRRPRPAEIHLPSTPSSPTPTKIRSFSAKTPMPLKPSSDTQ